MFGRSASRARSVFNAGLLKTFGKLSHLDIEKIDGRAERLVIELVEQYGWNENFAKQKAVAFELKLSVGHAMSLKGLPAAIDA